MLRSVIIGKWTCLVMGLWASTACACGDRLRPHLPPAIDAAPAPVDAHRPIADAMPQAPTIDARPVSRVVISELVLTPTHDWSDATPAYSGVPGNGAISAADQYVELHNVSTDVLDLTGWIIEFQDTAINISTLGTDGVLALSAGSTLAAVAPDGYLVLGNPAGVGSPDTFVVLRDASGTIVDDVEVGGATASRDMEHDGVGDGAPDASHNGYARGSFDEAIARARGGLDTDDDIADFDALPATPTRTNVAPIAPSAGRAPTATSTSTGRSYAVSRLLSATFDTAMASASFDRPAAVTVTANGRPVPLGFHTFEHDDHTLVLNPIGVLPFDSLVTVVIKGGGKGGEGVHDLAGTPLVRDVTFSVRTEKRPTPGARLRLNELCISPVRDWDDSTGRNGEPFDATPGPGPATFADEWIELLYAGKRTTSLRDYVLVFYRGPTQLQSTRAELRLTGDNTRLFGVGTAITAVHAGDRIVVGDPPGAIPTSVVVEIRDAKGTLIDSVEVGGSLQATDRGGDGVNTGAPGSGQDGRSTGIADEVVARYPDGTDSNAAAADFAYRTATLGASN